MYVPSQIVQRQVRRRRMQARPFCTKITFRINGFYNIVTRQKNVVDKCSDQVIIF